MDRSKCVVLVPVGAHIEPECALALSALEARGYAVRRVSGYAAIDQGRSQMASDALHDGFDELLWIDSDIGFDPDDVDRLRSHELPLVCGIYPKKGVRALAAHLLPETEHVLFGAGGGLLEIQYAATGFLLTHRRLYHAMKEQCALPVCNERFGRPVVPYFLPLLVPDGAGHWYLGEDFAFSERARRCGFVVMADTRIRLNHIGKCSYSWEDAGSERTRFGTYDFQVDRGGH